MAKRYVILYVRLVYPLYSFSITGIIVVIIITSTTIPCATHTYTHKHACTHTHTHTHNTGTVQGPIMLNAGARDTHTHTHTHTHRDADQQLAWPWTWREIPNTLGCLECIFLCPQLYSARVRGTGMHFVVCSNATGKKISDVVSSEARLARLASVYV